MFTCKYHPATSDYYSASLWNDSDYTVLRTATQSTYEFDNLTWSGKKTSPSRNEPLCSSSQHLLHLQVQHLGFLRHSESMVGMTDLKSIRTITGMLHFLTTLRIKIHGRPYHITQCQGGHRLRCTTAISTDLQSVSNLQRILISPTTCPRLKKSFTP
jgi:hypothetical protein